MAAVPSFRNNNMAAVTPLENTEKSQKTSPCVPLHCYYHIFTSSVIYYSIDARQHEMSLLISTSSRMFFGAIFDYCNAQKAAISSFLGLCCTTD